VAANICGVAVNVLATGLNSGAVDCTATSEAGADGQATRSGGGNTTQNGLVNVSLTDNTIQVPIAVAANICGVGVGILANVADVGDVVCWSAADLAAGPASGSYPTQGMVVVPASTAAVAGIALGLSKDLLQRSADVTLKERRPLIVVPRETPLGRGHLVQLLALHDAGAIVLPASPGFYHGPTRIDQLVDFVAGRVLDALGVPHTLYRRWTGELGAARQDH